MKDEVVSYTLDAKNSSPAFLVIEEHAHYMNMCAIEIFAHLVFCFEEKGLKIENFRNNSLAVLLSISVKKKNSNGFSGCTTLFYKINGTVKLALLELHCFGWLSSAEYFSANVSIRFAFQISLYYSSINIFQVSILFNYRNCEYFSSTKSIYTFQLLKVSIRDITSFRVKLLQFSQKNFSIYSENCRFLLKFIPKFSQNVSNMKFEIFFV